MSTSLNATPEPSASLLELVKAAIVDVIDRPKQPPAWELVQLVEERCGVKARWLIRQALEELTGEGQLALFPQPRTTRLTREYITSLLESEDLDLALRGTVVPGKAVESTIDALVLGARKYRGSNVTARILAGSSAEYLSRYFDCDVVPEGVSLDHSAKAAGLLERMAQQTLPPRPIKKPRGAKR